MRLFQLAYICRVYGGMTGFDADYLAFLDKTASRLDFRESSHMKALLVWLNSWGCRQFALEYHEQASEAILEWARRWESSLPDSSSTLDQLSDEDIDAACEAYANLSQRHASQRTRNRSVHGVRVGPTGAAKILFAARPGGFPPWDDPIRAKLGYDASPHSYRKYLMAVRQQISRLCTEAAQFGVPPQHIPKEVGRPRSTLPKLIDEYNWVTVTKGLLPPEPEEIAKWYRWSSTS